MEEKIWYAVLRDSDDNDWGTGSFDLQEAKRIARVQREIGHSDAYIAVIDDIHKVCIDEIHDID